MKNRHLIISGIFLSDVADTLKECGIPLTEENILACALRVQLDASAIAKATLQEMDYERCIEEIEDFRDVASDRMKDNPLVKIGTYLGQGERLRHVPVTVEMH